jgi:hypothetical protein
MQVKTIQYVKFVYPALNCILREDYVFLGVYYCKSYSKINDTLCTGCVDGYLLSTNDNFCYKTVTQCLWFNYISNTCVKCIDGY